MILFNNNNNILFVVKSRINIPFLKLFLTLISLSLSCLIILWPADSVPVCGQVSEDAPATAALILRQTGLSRCSPEFTDLFNSWTRPHLMNRLCGSGFHGRRLLFLFLCFFCCCIPFALSRRSYKARMSLASSDDGLEKARVFEKILNLDAFTFLANYQLFYFLIGASRRFIIAKCCKRKGKHMLFCVCTRGEG